MIRVEISKPLVFLHIPHHQFPAYLLPQPRRQLQPEYGGDVSVSQRGVPVGEGDAVAAGEVVQRKLVGRGPVAGGLEAFSDASGRDWWAQVADAWRAGDDFGIKMATDNGKTHVTLTPEETQVFLDTLEPVQQRWIDEVSSKGLDGAGLVQSAKDAVAANSQ